MNQRICVSKKITFAFMFSLFVLLFVLLGQLTLQSNQAKNSRAAIPTGVPIALPSPLAAPNCYTPAPKQSCLNPIYNRGTKDLELRINSETVEYLNAILNTADRYAIYRFNTFNEKQKATHLFSISKEEVNALINSTTDPKLTLSNVTADDISHSTYVIFGIPTATTSLTTCSKNTFVSRCSKLSPLD
ncbi:MAG: hypothetical protein WAV30_00825 [Microgenomates group bacterium]